MAELKRTGYAKRLWDAWKEYEKENGALSGVELAARVQRRVGGVFDDTKLSKIHKGKRRATVDEHYALATELRIDPDRLAGQDPAPASAIELKAIEEETLPVVEVRPPKTPRKNRRVQGSRTQRSPARPPAPQGPRK